MPLRGGDSRVTRLVGGDRLAPVPRVVAGGAALPALTSLGTGLLGLVAVGAAELPALAGTGAGTIGLTGTGSAELPPLAGTGDAEIFRPSDVPEVAAGFWWDPDHIVDEGGTEYLLERNGDTDWDIEMDAGFATVSNNGHTQLVVDSSHDGLPTRASSSQAGWSGATTWAWWMQKTVAQATGVNLMFSQWDFGAGDSRFRIFENAGALFVNVSDDGTAIQQHRWNSADHEDLDWHWIVMKYLPLEETPSDRLKLFVDDVEQPPTSLGNPEPTLHDSTLRFSYILNHVDTIHYGPRYYCNGDPSDADLERMKNYHPPVAA